MNEKEMKRRIAHNTDWPIVTLIAAALILAIAITLTGCEKKEGSEYYRPTETPGRPPLENPGQVIVTPPEIPTTPGEPGQPAPPPAPIILVDKEGNAQQITPGRPADVEAGTYVMTTVTTPTGPQALPSGSTVVPATPETPGSVTVAPVSGGGTSVAILPPLPVILAGTGTMTVAPADVSTSAIALAPMTREVVLEGVLQGLAPEALSASVFTLEGVLNTRRIDQPFAAALPARGGFRADGASTRAAEIYAAETAFAIAADGTFTVRVRLLGIDAAATQQLRLTLTYKDTTVPPYVYVADVTSLLVGFNAGVTSQPAHLQATLSFGLGGIEGTITGWMPAPPEDLPGE